MVVAIAIALSITIPALAESGFDHDSTNVQGTVKATIDVDSPNSAILLTTQIIPGDTAAGSGIVNVLCNKNTWSLAASATAPGKMTDGHGNTLHNALQVQDSASAYQELGGAAITLISGQSATTSTPQGVTANFHQLGDWNDIASGYNYSLSVTFTGSMTP